MPLDPTIVSTQDALVAQLQQMHAQAVQQRAIADQQSRTLTDAVNRLTDAQDQAERVLAQAIENRDAVVSELNLHHTALQDSEQAGSNLGGAIDHLAESLRVLGHPAA